MTEAEMQGIRSLLWECGEILVCFDERTNDKKMLFATKDEPTMLRYTIESSVFTEEQKQDAQYTLDLLTQEAEEAGEALSQDDDEHVLFRAQDSKVDDRAVGVPQAHTWHDFATTNALNAQLLFYAPRMAEAFCCKASMVRFIKTLVESAGYEPEIRDGGFYFDLFIDEDEMTWGEYFGGVYEEPAT